MFVMSVLALSGCSGSEPDQISPPPGTPAATATLTRTLTPTVTLTLTPTPIILSRLGTPLPESRETISVDNADQLVEMGRWGKGIPAAVAFSPDGALVAVAASSGLYLYDSTTFQSVWSIELETPLTAVAFTTDSTTLAAGNTLGTIFLWNREGEPLQTLPGKGFPVLGLAFSPDGSRLAASNWDRTIQVWRVSNGQLTRTLRGHLWAARALAFSPNGDVLYSWSNREPVQRWPIPGGAPVKEWYIGQTNDGRTGSSAAFSGDGTVFASAQDWRVRVFNTEDGTTRSQLQPVTAPISAVVLSKDGSLAATSDQKSVKIWQTEDGSMLYETPAAPATFLAFSADGQSLLLQGSTPYFQIWQFTDEESFQPASAPEYLPDHPAGMSFQPESGALVMPLLNGNLQSFLPEPNLTAVNTSPPSTRFDSVAASPDGLLMAGGNGSAQVQVWQVEDGEVLYTLRGLGLNAGKLAFSPDSSLLAAGSGDRRLRIYRMEDGGLVHNSEMNGAIAQIGFSPDGSLLAVGSENLIQLWRVSDWTLLANYTGTRFAFAPQEDLLAVADSSGREQVITLYRAWKRSKVSSFSAEGNSLAFSPDGSLLAVAGQDITLWNTEEGKQITALAVPRAFGSVEFSPQGDILILAAWDGVVTLWGIP